jgi:type I restriction enzyme S subunit
MSDATTQWVEVPLGNLFIKLVNGGTPSTSVAAYWGGKVPWVTGADFTSRGIDEIRRYVSPLGIRSSATSVVDPGNLLVVTRTGVGKLAIAEEPIAISQDITGVYPDNEKVDPKFLYFLLSLELENLKKLNQGTSINGIIRSDFERHLVCVPIDVSEQRKIALIFQTIDQAIEKTEALIEKYQKIKAGLMHDLFTRGIGHDGKLRPLREQAPELYQETPIGWIPKEWEVSGVTDLCSEIFLGLTTKVDYVEDGGIPLVRATDISGGRLSFSNALNISVKQHRELTRYRKAKLGDVLISKSGSLGICALVVESREFSIYESIIVMQPDPLKLESRFLLWLVRAEETQKRLLGETVGSTVGHLNLLDFRRLIVPEVPLDEQVKIATVLEGNQCTLDSFSDQLSKYERQKSGLMHDLLTGKVQVNLDPFEKAHA